MIYLACNMVALATACVMFRDWKLSSENSSSMITSVNIPYLSCFSLANFRSTWAASLSGPLLSLGVHLLVVMGT
jgi:hypothetical protein